MGLNNVDDGDSLTTIIITLVFTTATESVTGTNVDVVITLGDVLGLNFKAAIVE